MSEQSVYISGWSVLGVFLCDVLVCAFAECVRLSKICAA